MYPSFYPHAPRPWSYPPGDIFWPPYGGWPTPWSHPWPIHGAFYPSVAPGDGVGESGGVTDFGPRPYVVNMERVAEENPYFRRALWTGNHLQLTLMSINVGEEIGLEVHPYLDQFLRIERGEGMVCMGDSPDHLDFEAMVCEGYAIFIPAGKWHNLINTGNRPIKLYSIYAPPAHPHGTVHPTKREAMATEQAHS